MGIFNTPPKIIFSDQHVHQVRHAMSEELGFQLTKEQAIERMCTLYMNEIEEAGVFATK